MEVNFRKMKEEDKGEVLNMMRVFYASPAVHTNGAERVFNNDIDNCVNDNPYLEGYIFEAEGKICGYSMVAKSFSTEFGKQCIWIEDIYLNENSRGLGIGRKFFQFLKDRYNEAVLRLEVKEENTSAIRMYSKNGFEFLPYLEMKKD